MKKNLSSDKPRCNCGIFGIFGSKEAATSTYYGLHSLQHRGQEAAGIITFDKDNYKKFASRRYDY